MRLTDSSSGKWQLLCMVFSLVSDLGPKTENAVESTQETDQATPSTCMDTSDYNNNKTWAGRKQPAPGPAPYKQTPPLTSTSN